MFSTGKVELLLHAFDHSRQDRTGFGAIRLAEFDALDRPIRLDVGVAVDPFDHNPDERFTRWVGFPDTRDDRRLQLVSQNGGALVEWILPVKHVGYSWKQNATKRPVTKIAEQTSRSS